MKWNLLINLSAFALVMGFATVYWIPIGVEPFLWLIIFIFCAYQIALKSKDKFFLHGLVLSLINSIWITGFHVILFEDYYLNHPEMQMPYDMLDAPRLATAITGPVVGVIAGVVQGLFAFIASKLIKK